LINVETSVGWCFWVIFYGSLKGELRDFHGISQPNFRRLFEDGGCGKSRGMVGGVGGDVIPSGKQNHICGTQNHIKFHIILNYYIPKIP
jgi:hypothetical protein